MGDQGWFGELAMNEEEEFYHAGTIVSMLEMESPATTINEPPGK